MSGIRKGECRHIPTEPAWLPKEMSALLEGGDEDLRCPAGSAAESVGVAALLRTGENAQGQRKVDTARAQVECGGVRVEHLLHRDALGDFFGRADVWSRWEVLLVHGWAPFEKYSTHP